VPGGICDGCVSAEASSMHVTSMKWDSTSGSMHAAVVVSALVLRWKAA
jgi:hypothetical protein